METVLLGLEFWYSTRSIQKELNSILFVLKVAVRNMKRCSKIIKRREGICHLWCEQSILSRRIRPRIETESREKSCAMKMKERELLCRSSEICIKYASQILYLALGLGPMNHWFMQDLNKKDQVWSILSKFNTKRKRNHWSYDSKVLFVRITNDDQHHHWWRNWILWNYME